MLITGLTPFTLIARHGTVLDSGPPLCTTVIIRREGCNTFYFCFSKIQNYHFGGVFLVVCAHQQAGDPIGSLSPTQCCQSAL